MGGRTWISLLPEEIQLQRMENQLSFLKAEFQTISFNHLADIATDREGIVSSALIPSQIHRKRTVVILTSCQELSFCVFKKIICIFQVCLFLWEVQRTGVEIIYIYLPNKIRIKISVLNLISQ